jgi:hypothetical protein
MRSTETAVFMTSVRAAEDRSTVAPFSRSTGAAAACDLVERQVDREPCPDGFMHRQRDVGGRIAQKVLGATVPSDDTRVLIYCEGRIGRENNQITSINHHVFLGRAGSNGQIQVACRYARTLTPNSPARHRFMSIVGADEDRIETPGCARRLHHRARVI